MALSFVEDMAGSVIADRAAAEMEYIRNRDPSFDPFSQPDA